MKKITAVIIGAGSRGKAYAKQMKLHPEKYQVVGVAEPIEARRSEIREMYDIPEENCFADYKELLSKPKMASLA
ncbi:MAG: Gfo/Idh/MocA family oxidoreductase, partial [Clostridia bacterium]|nr:Gfo/Idh/MocA family oxidoreductase [Clostridia bacterium]